MSKPRVRITLVPRDSNDAPEHVNFAKFCLDHHIDISDAEPVRSVIDSGAARLVKDELLETEARAEARSVLESANHKLDREEPSRSNRTDAAEPKTVAGAIKAARDWLVGIAAAGWRITVRELARGAVEGLMESTKDDG